MITKSTPLFLFAISVSCLLTACNRDDDKDANTLQSSLTYECTNGVQKTHVSNNTTLSISCDNYGGCDANAKQCAKLPVLPDAPECTDNAYKCADSVRFVCDVPNWVAVEGCAHGCNAATNECNVPASGDCTDAQKKCENDTAYVCSGGSWGEGTSCNGLGCNVATNECNVPASGDCTDAQKKCENDTAYVCADGSWGEGTSCNGLGCNVATDECNPSASGDCTDAQKKCENDTAYVCADGSWGEGTSCNGLGCNVVTDECNPPVLIDCMGTEKKCENDTAYVCAGNHWDSGTSCGGRGCNASTNECNPPLSVDCTGTEKKCENDTAYVCAGNHWDSGTSCGGRGCNAVTNECNPPSPGDCTDTERKCENNKAYVCSGGSWGTGTDCGTLGCYWEYCKECEDNDKKCENDHAYVCTLGLWVATDSCYGNGCNGDVCVTGSQCLDGVIKCEADRAYVCRNGYWGKGESCNGFGCNGNVCATNANCDDNDRKCEYDNAYICENGVWRIDKSCNGLGCSGTICVSGTTNCTGSEQKCEGNTAYVCNKGFWGQGKACGEAGCNATTKACNRRYHCDDEGNLVDDIAGTSAPCHGVDLCIEGADDAFCYRNFYASLNPAALECSALNAEMHECGAPYFDENDDTANPPNRFEYYDKQSVCRHPFNDMTGFDSMQGYRIDLKAEACPFGVCTSANGCEANKTDTSCICDKNSEGEARTFCREYFSRNEDEYLETSRYMVSVPCLCDGDNCDWNWDASIVRIDNYAYCPDDVKGQFTCPVLGSTCVNDDTLCKDGEYYVCEDQRWSHKRACAAGCASNQKACRETSCENGDTLCKDGRYYVCENGSWGNGTKCEHYLCENDKVCKADDSCSKKTIYMKDRDGWCVDGQAISCSNDGKLVATNCADTNSFCYIDGVMGTAGCLKNVQDGVNIESCSADDFLKETSSCVFIPGEEGGTYYGDGGDNYYITRSCRRPVSTLDSASYTAGNNYDQILTAMKCHHGCDASKGGCNERFFNEDGLCTPALHECKIDHCSRGALDGDHWSDKTKYSCMCMNHECKLTTTQTSEIDHCVEGTEVIECTDYNPIYGID